MWLTSHLERTLAFVVLSTSVLATPALASAAAVSAPTAAAASAFPTSRSKHQWPFASDSIWNVPLGSEARIVDATIGSRGVGVDTDWYVATRSDDPLVDTYMTGAWGKGRCTGTTAQQQGTWHPELLEKMHVPYDLVIEDARDGWTPNNASAFLAPDGKTLDQFNVTARCTAGGPLYGYRVPQQDIYGDGISGGHLGSGLSSIGGSIRTGELFDDEPIHHALKLVIWGKWLYYDKDAGSGHRWPACCNDAYAPTGYTGTNPALRMGSLLAIRPGVSEASVGLTSTQGRKLFHALQDYGGYVADDSGFDYNYLTVEHAAAVEYQQRRGVILNDDSEFGADFDRLVALLGVVDDNGPDRVGGGGTRRQPPAPPIAD